MTKNNQELVENAEVLKNFENLSKDEKIKRLKQLNLFEKAVAQIDFDDLAQKSDLSEVIGDSYENLTEEQMLELQAAGDVNAETTPILAVSIASSGYCGGAVSAALLSAIKC